MVYIFRYDVASSSLRNTNMTWPYKLSMYFISNIVRCPILVPFQTLPIRDTRTSFGIESAKNLLHGRLNSEELLVPVSISILI